MSQRTIWRAGQVRLNARKHRPAPVQAHKRARSHTQKHVILIAFPQQQWFRECATMLRYTYIVCRVKMYKIYTISMLIYADLVTLLNVFIM